MSVQVEKLENSMAKLTIEVSAEDFTAALEKAYQADKNKISVPGFRKGKAPRKMIQKMYGAGIFYEDAANRAINEAYPKAADECGETIVSAPEIDVVQIEEGKPFIFTAEVALKPEVTLGEYKGLEVEMVLPVVTEEEVDAAIEKEREQNSRMIDVDDRPVANGDTIKLDFEGFMDGEAFEGGKGTDYPLTIGSGSFIPGFEEQLIGKEIGEETEVNVTFPKNYQSKELQGKPAVFKCTVKEISVKELPALDDEFAQDVSEFDTLEEYREDVRAKLNEQKLEASKNEKEAKAVEAAVANATMDLPEPMIEDQTKRMVDEFGNRIRSQGLTLEQYMQYTGMTMADLQEQTRPDAVRRIQNSLVVEAVAKAENLEVSEERMEEELKKMAASYRMPADKLKEAMGENGLEQMKADLAMQLAVELMADAAVVVEPVETAEEEVEEIAVDGSEDVSDAAAEFTVEDAPAEDAE
ncbi:MAG: trigger factor [Lachnospiraceae bacterium]|nr:trigger factor [Lachnospiraceae bacterium]